MKRWDAAKMLDIGRQLFSKIHRKKRRAHHNHELHFLAREIEDWLPQGVKSWEYSELLKWFFGVCWEVKVAAIAAGLLFRHVKAAAPTLVPDLAVAA